MVDVPHIFESYGPDLLLVSLWLSLSAVPLYFTGWLIIRYGFRPDLLQMLFVSALSPIIIAVFTLRFRVTFTDDSFVYRRWGSTIRVLYTDISRIDVANVTPIGKQSIGAFVVTKHGDRLPFWLKLFPRAAVTRFFQLAGQQ